MNEQAAMPKYKCHKEVHAIKIAGAEVNKDGSVTIAPHDEWFAVFTTEASYGERFKGNDSDPGYYVIYEGGYKSWSPSKEFESGYTPIPT
ncbi:MAG TPA: hypothetical protein ENI26_02145 [Methylophaga aminisulfidivorans]|uniref:Uncharacterized protein n=2 Tax=root TaxID=1 RepID=A0A7C1W1N7_9GAMM|nr:hypothetical protein [Methylophaga aminisulfidivorans]